MSSSLIGIIAEDNTDCETIRKIVQRVLGNDTRTKSWASKGCSTLQRKLSAKLELMYQGGCNAFIIVRDLDRNPQNNSLNDEVKLRESLEASSSTISHVKKQICIPIEELEAWFWSDPKIIQSVGRGKGQAHQNPHLIVKPKEQLIKLSIGKNRKPRYSTNMNPQLAELLNLQLCSQRCPSFKNLLEFLQSL